MKICPVCEDEFEDWVEACPDCGSDLRWDHEMPSLPESAAGVCVTTGSRSSLKPLSAALRAEGIATRITEDSTSPGLRVGILVAGLPLGPPIGGWTYRLEVAPGDASRAEVMTDRLRSGELARLPPVPPAEGQCPACRAPVGDATECPECSLVLVADGEGAEDEEDPPDLGLPALDPLGFPKMRR